jgi:hypothetical protein
LRLVIDGDKLGVLFGEGFILVFDLLRIEIILSSTTNDIGCSVTIGFSSFLSSSHSIVQQHDLHFFILLAIAIIPTPIADRLDNTIDTITKSII